jgi:Tol biopolymer transport system component
MFLYDTVILASTAIFGSVIPSAWLPDASGIVFAHDNGAYGLWRTFGSSGARRQRLPFAPSSAPDPAVSRRGIRLAYTAYREETSIWRIEFVAPSRQPAEPTSMNLSTKADYAPACSPDGRRIAFIAERSGAPERRVCDRDGSGAQRLTSFGGVKIAGPPMVPGCPKYCVVDPRCYGHRQCPQPRLTPPARGSKWPWWSPNGQWLYYASRQDRTGIWKVRSGGGTPVQITHGTDDDVPQPSADGKFIYYNKGWPEPLSIRRIPVDGDEPTKIIDGVSTGGQWTVSVDGIYFFTAPDAKGHSEMRRYEFATGTTKRIVSVERSVSERIAVCPDARTILYPQWMNRVAI